MRIEAKRNPEQLRREAQEYLKETDWYVVRKVETNKPLPADVQQKRTDARAILSKVN